MRDVAAAFARLRDDEGYAVGHFPQTDAMARALVPLLEPGSRLIPDGLFADTPTW